MINDLELNESNDVLKEKKLEYKGALKQVILHIV
jgi:hypothetical protein